MLHVEREHSVARTNVLRTDVFFSRKERRDGCDECGCEGNGIALQSNGFGTIGAGRSLFACANAITTYKIGMRFLIHFDGCNICLLHIGEYVKA